MDMTPRSRRNSNLRTWRLTTSKKDKRSHDEEDSGETFKMRLLNRHVSFVLRFPNDGIASSISWVEVYKYPSSSSTLSSQYHTTSLLLTKMTLVRSHDCGSWVSKTTRITGVSLLRLVSKPTSRDKYFKSDDRFFMRDIKNDRMNCTWSGRVELSPGHYLKSYEWTSQCRMLARRSSCACKIFVAHSATVHSFSIFFSSSSKSQ